MPFIRKIKPGLFEVGVNTAGYRGAVGRRGRTHVHGGYVVRLVEIIEHHLPVAG